MDELLPSARSLQLDVGGTIIELEHSLIGLAPVGSLAACYLAPMRNGNDLPRFVDERPRHMSLLVDCLRHGVEGMLLMNDYDAAIVRDLLMPQLPSGTGRTTVAATAESTAAITATDSAATPDSNNARNVASAQADAVVHFVVDGEYFSVLHSTLCPADESFVPAASPLRHLVETSGMWRPTRIADSGRMRVHQNAIHFALLLDCLRHGVGHLQHVTSEYDLWGVRSLGIYYGIDRVRDAAQLAIGYRAYCALPAKSRCVTYVLPPRLVRRGWYHDPNYLVWSNSDDEAAKVAVRHPRGWSTCRVMELIAAALGLTVDAIAAYGLQKRWYRFAPGDEQSYTGWRVNDRDDNDDAVALVFAEPLTGCNVPHRIMPFGGLGRHNTPTVLLVTELDASSEVYRVRHIGPVFVQFSAAHRTADEVILQACQQREPAAVLWKHQAFVANVNFKPCVIKGDCSWRDAMGYLNVIDLWVVHGDPGIDAIAVCRAHHRQTWS